MNLSAPRGVRQFFVQEFAPILPKDFRMTDRIINKAWWLAVMALICTTGVAGLFLSYRSLFDLLAGRWQVGGLGVILGFGLAFSTWLLCRHRNDLLSF